MRVKQYLAAFALSSMLVAGAPLGALAQSTSINTDISGYSIEQLEQLIAKLTKQLAEMKKGSPCYVSNKDLSFGDGEDDGLSEDVRRLQNFLVEKKLLFYKPTGYFGKATRAALGKFQANQGLAVNYDFSGATREKAHAMSCKKTVKASAKVEAKTVAKTEAKKQSGVVKSISVKTGGNKVYWSVDGYSAQGFKVVWSRTPGPTYPNRYPQDQYKYFDKPSTSETALEAFDGAGTYYVRVCEYLGGSCGAYSNEVTLNLE